MDRLFGIGDLVLLIERRTGIALNPRIISEAFYSRKVPVSAPVRNGRRYVSVDDVPALVSFLRRNGHLPMSVNPFDFVLKPAELVTQ